MRVAIFCFGAVLVYAARTVLYPVLDIIAREYGLSSVETAAVVSGFYVCYASMQFPGGLLSDRFGVKRVLATACLLSSVALVGLGLFSVSYPLLLLFAAFYGFTAGGFFPIAQGAIVRLLDQGQRGLGLSLLSLSGSIGLVLGLGIAGPLYLATSSWRLSFLLIAVPYALLGLVFAWVLPEIHSERARGVSFTRLLKDRHLWATSEAGWCAGFAFWVVVVWGPTYFISERGIDLQVAGLLAAVVALVGIVPCIVVGRLSDRVGRKAIVAALLLLGAVMVLLLPRAVSLSAILLVLIGYGVVGRQVADPILAAWLGDRMRAQEEGLVGRAAGLYGLTAMSSAIIAPIISGWVRDRMGSLDWSFYLAGVILLVGLVFVGLADEPRRASSPGARQLEENSPPQTQTP